MCGQQPLPKGSILNWRKTFFRIHGWLGLNIGLLLFMVCFSGSFATLSHEIDWLINPTIRTETRNEPYNWTAMHETLTNYFSNHVISGIYAPTKKGFAALAFVSTPNGQTRKAYLNPYTGTLQGHTSFFNIQRFFRSFHRRFFDGKRGITLVTLTAFVLLISTISGFCFYKGWLKQVFALKTDRGPRRFWSDLHKTTGIWALLFSLLIAITGVFYFVEVCFQTANNYQALLPPPLPHVDKTSLAQYGPQPKLRTPNEYAQIAQEAFPNLTIRSLRMPTRPGAPVYFDGQAGNPIVRDRANKILIHPFSGKVIAIQKDADLTTVPFITDIVDPLHFGYFGGLITKIIWCFFGLVLSFSILAGTYLWFVRTLTKKASEKQTLLRLRGAGISAILTLAYFIIVIFTTIEGIQFYGPKTHTPHIITEQIIGPYRVQIDQTVPPNSQNDTKLTVRFLGTGFPNYKKVAIHTSDDKPILLRGSATAPTATLKTMPNDIVQLQITTRDNIIHKAQFHIPSTVPIPSVEHLPTLPDAPPGVWWTIALFTLLTLAAIIGWFCLILQAVRKHKIPHQHTSYSPLPKQAVP